MATTATVHVHPACASNPRLIERIQAETGGLVVVSNGKPRLNFHVVQNGQAQIEALNHLEGRRFIVVSDHPPFGGDAA